MTRRPRGRRRSGGFTIIELALVLTITGILMAFAFYTYGTFVNKARFTQAKTALRHLQKTELIYFSENDRYTDNVTLLDFDPVKYDYYRISIVLDNTARDYTGIATGIGAMAGDLWTITPGGEAAQDNIARLKFR